MLKPEWLPSAPRTTKGSICATATRNKGFAEEVASVFAVGDDWARAEIGKLIASPTMAIAASNRSDLMTRSPAPTKQRYLSGLSSPRTVRAQCHTAPLTLHFLLVFSVACQRVACRDDHGADRFRRRDRRLDRATGVASDSLNGGTKSTADEQLTLAA